MTRIILALILLATTATAAPLLGVNDSYLQAGGSLDEVTAAFDAVTVLSFYPQDPADAIARAKRYRAAGLEVVFHCIAYHHSTVELPEFFNLPAGTRYSAYLTRLSVVWDGLKDQSLIAIDLANELRHTGDIGTTVAGIYGAAGAAGCNVRRVNEYGILADPVFSDQWLSILKSSTALVDVIGIQCHIQCEPGMVPPMDALNATLRRYATIGLPIHISELSVPSEAYGWTEQEQADWITAFCEMCATIPEIKLVAYWDLSDAQAWNESSGLIRADGTYKPAWYALVKIHDEWNQKAAPEPEQEPLPWWKKIWRGLWTG